MYTYSTQPLLFYIFLYRKMESKHDEKYLFILQNEERKGIHDEK